MNDIVYIDHMQIADVPAAILDMQMSKVPIISGYAVGIEIVPPLSTTVQPSASPQAIQKCFRCYNLNVHG